MADELRAGMDLDDAHTYLFEVIRPQDPGGFIQWKGTDVCVDLRCKCGGHQHKDAEFLYFWKCPECGTWYALNPYISLVEMPPRYHEEIEDVQST